MILVKKSNRKDTAWSSLLVMDHRKRDHHTQDFHDSVSGYYWLTHLKVVESKFCLKAIPHLDKSMIWLVVQYLYASNVAIVGKEIEKFISIYSLQMKTVHLSAMCSNRNIKPLLHLCQTFHSSRFTLLFSLDWSTSLWLSAVNNFNTTSIRIWRKIHSTITLSR